MKIYVDANLTHTASVFCMGAEGNVPRIAVLPADPLRKITEAECEAVLWALKMAPPDVPLDIYSDSEPVVKKLNREWKTKPEKRLYALLEKVWARCKGRKVYFHWVPRKQNLAGKVLG